MATKSNQGPQILSSEDFHLQLQSKQEPESCVLRKQFVAESVNKVKLLGVDSERLLQFVISTGDVDRYGDTVDAKGWQLEHYNANPVVLFAHDSHNPPIGRGLELTVSKGKLKATAEFMDNDVDTSGFSDMIFRMLTNGFLKATSVGFMPIKYNWITEPVYNEDNEEVGERYTGGIEFLEQELLEFSVVPVPANPFALLNAKAAGIDLNPLQGWFEQALDEWKTYQKQLGMDKDDVEGLFKTMRELNTRIRKRGRNPATKISGDNPMAGKKKAEDKSIANDEVMVDIKEQEVPVETPIEVKAEVEEEVKETPAPDVKEIKAESEEVEETKDAEDAERLMANLNSKGYEFKMENVKGNVTQTITIKTSTIKELASLIHNKSLHELREFIGIRNTAEQKADEEVEIPVEAKEVDENIEKSNTPVLQSDQNGEKIVDTEDLSEIRAALPDIVRSVLEEKLNGFSGKLN